MSVFYVVQWSVNPLDQEACEQAVKAIAEHVKLVHPPIRSFRAPRPDGPRLRAVRHDPASLAGWVGHRRPGAVRLSPDR